jgi:hypothetical protein
MEGIMDNVRAAAFGHCRGIVRICGRSVIFPAQGTPGIGSSAIDALAMPE